MRNATLLILTLSVIGCRADGGGGGGGGGVDAPAGSVDAPGVAGTTVKAIRMNQPTNGQMLSVPGVVVVGRVTSTKYGKLWVQDPGGGQYSGIEVFCDYGGTHPNCSMTRAQIDAIAPGSVVDVTGAFSSFLINTAPAGAQPSYEIESPMITAKGTTMAPVAVDVSAATIAKDQLAAAGAAPYKGAYVHVTGGPMTVSSITATEFAQTCTDKSMPAQTGATFSGFEVGTTPKLAVGLGFYKTVTYCLPCTGVAMPYACTNAITNQTFTSVSGIVEPEYSSNGAVYLQISPVVDADLAH